MCEFQLKNAFDSHVHWEATGANETNLDLSKLTKPSDFLSVAQTPAQLRGEWWVGYNWDQKNFHSQDGLTRQTLDQHSFQGPILLHRADRHAAWVNTAALMASGFFKKFDSPQIEGGVFQLDENGFPTGYVIDRAMDLIKEYIPKPSKAQIKANLKTGAEVFNKAGYTHIRDLTCSEIQFEQSLLLESQNELTVCVEQFFDVYSASSLEKTIQVVKSAMKQKSNLIRVKGIKLYYDGALGSEGALLSEPYYGKGENRGFRMYSQNTLQEMMQLVFQENLECAVHVIGDQAAHEVVEISTSLLQLGLNVKLHLEHAELLRPETIQKMRALNVTCHIQPCHWLSDKIWVNQKLPNLKQHLFRWYDLEEYKVNFYFGSDTPIEPTSVERNLNALEDASQSGIQKTKYSPLNYMTHPDSNWLPGCESFFSGSRCVRTVFGHKNVYQS